MQAVFIQKRGRI